MTIRILTGDCREHMAAMEPNSVDSIVTDPPYMLNFMGKEWDAPTMAGHVVKFEGRERQSGGLHRGPGTNSRGYADNKEPILQQQWHESWAREAYRVLKPGGYLLAFGGTRTFHRLTVAIEDAGFEIRDCLMWLYGSGFPKSLDVSKAIDKAAGAEREVVGQARRTGKDVGTYGAFAGDNLITAPATDLARQWDGWGTALKPAWEPIIMARKPLIGSVAANVTQYGTGGLNIDGCRIEAQGRPHIENAGKPNAGILAGSGNKEGSRSLGTTDIGRWPPNVILDETAAAALDAMSGECGGGYGIRGGGSGGVWNPTDRTKSAGQTIRGGGETVGYGDTGGASRFMKVVQPDPLPIESGDELRFFYGAKAGRAERNKGLEGMPANAPVFGDEGGTFQGLSNSRIPQSNHHPTVKPLDLMQWLCRLVTPPGGTVLDCFGGSGSTMVAADREGFHGIYIEADPEYAEIARRRIMGDCPLFAEVAD